MNICMLATYPVFSVLGGRESYIIDLSKSLIRKGHEVTVFSTGHPQGLSYEENNGIKLYYFSDIVPLDVSGKNIQKIKKHFLCLHNKYHFDVLHSHHSFLSFGLNTNCDLKIPVVFTMHGVAFSGSIERKILPLIKKISFRNLVGYGKRFFEYKSKQDLHEVLLTKADAITCVNTKLSKEIIARFKLDVEKVFSIPCGVDTDLFKPGLNINSLRDKYGLGNDKVILYVGRLNEAKGIDRIIKALPDIISKIKDVKFLIVGDGEFRDVLVELVDSLDLNKKVIFVGAIEKEELPYYYNLCDVFALLSIRPEGMPLTLLEAMASGKPVIVSDMVNCVDEIERKIGSEFFIRNKNQESLAYDFIDSLRSKKRVVLSQNQREKFIENFSKDCMIEDTIKIYEKIIRNKRLYTKK